MQVESIPAVWLSVNVIALTKTWSTDAVPDSEMFDVGYSIYRTDRSIGKSGGGVLLAVKSSIPSFRRRALEPNSSEIVAIEIMQKNSPKFIVSAVYRPPNTNPRNSLPISTHVWQNRCNFLPEGRCPYKKGGDARRLA